MKSTENYLIFPKLLFSLLIDISPNLGEERSFAAETAQGEEHEIINGFLYPNVYYCVVAYGKVGEGGI